MPHRHRNNTTSTISSLQLSYQLNNLPSVTETWSGTLLPSDTAAYTFTTPMNITLPHQMDIKVWAKFSTPTLGNPTYNDSAHKAICMTLAGTYDVGGGNQHIPTFTQAVRELRDCGQHGAVTLRIFGKPQGGSLQGLTAVNLDTSGLYPIKVTYGNGPLQDTVIVVHVRECKRLSFVGLVLHAGLSGGGTVSCDGSRFIACEDIVVDSCHVFGNFNGVLAFRGVKNLTVTNSTFTGLGGISTIDDNPINPPFDQNAGTFLIQNNSFRTLYNAICINGDQRNVDLIIDRNRFDTCGTGLDIASEEDIRSVVFSNNIMMNGPNEGVIIGNNCSSCRATNGFKFYNNMISGGDTTILSCALCVQGFGSMEIVHNSFWGMVQLNPLAASYPVRDNIFANHRGFLIAGNFSRDYNCYFRADSSVDIMNGYHTLADLYQAFPSSDGHSFEANPGFVSSTDFHTTSTSIVDRGLNLVTLSTTDIDGDTWSNPPDVGADENGLIIIASPEPVATAASVFPTVFHDRLEITLHRPKPGTYTTLTLTAMDGKTVASTTFEGEKLNWSLPQIATGCYILTLISLEESAQHFRVLKE
jgi:hypothetical protein